MHWPQWLPLLPSHIPYIVVKNGTSNRPQKDVGKYLGPYSPCLTLDVISKTLGNDLNPKLQTLRSPRHVNTPW